MLTLEERDGQVFFLILKRDFVADQTVPRANQLCQFGLLRRACRTNRRLQGRGHARQDYRVDFICFGQSPNGLREPPCASRIQLYAWQVGQSLFKLPMVSAGGFIGDPVNLPLPKPGDQGLVAFGRICKLLLAVSRMDVYIERQLRDVDSDRLCYNVIHLSAVLFLSSGP